MCAATHPGLPGQRFHRPAHDLHGPIPPPAARPKFGNHRRRFRMSPRAQAARLGTAAVFLIYKSPCSDVRNFFCADVNLLCNSRQGGHAETIGCMARLSLSGPVCRRLSRRRLRSCDPGHRRRYRGPGLGQVGGPRNAHLCTGYQALPRLSRLTIQVLQWC